MDYERTLLDEDYSLIIFKVKLNFFTKTTIKNMRFKDLMYICWLLCFQHCGLKRSIGTL